MIEDPLALTLEKAMQNSIIRYCRVNNITIEDYLTIVDAIMLDYHNKIPLGRAVRNHSQGYILGILIRATEPVLSRHQSRL